MFNDQEWVKLLSEILPQRKMIAVNDPGMENEARELAKMLVEASPNFALFAQPNPRGMLFLVSRTIEAEPGDISHFAFNFALSSNKLLQEIGVAGFRATNGN